MLVDKLKILKCKNYKMLDQMMVVSCVQRHKRVKIQAKQKKYIQYIF